MWYVIRTFTGKEEEVCTWIKVYVEGSLYTKCFVPYYEDVFRKGGIGNVLVKRMFDGYLFLETDKPEQVAAALRRYPEYSVIMIVPEQEERLFCPIHPE